MKTKLFLFFLSMQWTGCHSDRAEISAFYEEAAYQAIASEDFTLALELLEPLLRKPPSEVGHQLAQYYKGSILTKQGCYREAIPFLLPITKVSKFDKWLDESWLSQDELWEERGAAVLDLANNFIALRQYAQALHFTKISEEHYSNFGCGTMIIVHMEYLNELKLQCYLGIGDIQKVIECLNHKLISIENGSELDQLIYHIRQQYSREVITNAMETFINVKTEQVLDDEYPFNSVRFKTIVFDQEIELMDEYTFLDQIPIGTNLSDEVLIEFARSVQADLVQKIKSSNLYIICSQ